MVTVISLKRDKDGSCSPLSPHFYGKGRNQFDVAKIENDEVKVPSLPVVVSYVWFDKVVCMLKVVYHCTLCCNLEAQKIPNVTCHFIKNEMKYAVVLYFKVLSGSITKMDKIDSTFRCIRLLSH